MAASSKKTTTGPRRPKAAKRRSTPPSPQETSPQEASPQGRSPRGRSPRSTSRPSPSRTTSPRGTASSRGAASSRKQPQHKEPSPGFGALLQILATDGARIEHRQVTLGDLDTKPRSRRTVTKKRFSRPAEARTLTSADREKRARRLTANLGRSGLSELLAAMAHPQRLTILAKLLGTEATHQMLAKETGLKPGPLYYHLRELRSAGLIGPKVRDLYVLTAKGRRALLGALAMGKAAG